MLLLTIGFVFGILTVISLELLGALFLLRRLTRRAQEQESKTQSSFSSGEVCRDNFDLSYPTKQVILCFFPLLFLSLYIYMTSITNCQLMFPLLNFIFPLLISCLRIVMHFYFQDPLFDNDVQKNKMVFLSDFI